jgi:hypothetical protein
VNRDQLWSALQGNATLKSCPSFCARSTTVALDDACDTLASSRSINERSKRYFCGKCSTSIATETDQDKGCLWIPMGTLKEFDPSLIDPANDYHVCCNEQVEKYAMALSNLRPRCNKLVIRILTHVTTLRLVLLIRMVACIRWLAVNAIFVIQHRYSSLPAALSASPKAIQGQRILPQLEGSCDCGSIRWEASNVLMSKICICHCESCQKCSGTSGIPFCSLDREGVRDVLLGEHQTSALGSYSSSTIATRYFCTKCATPVAFQYNQEADMLWIPMGSFANFNPAMMDSSKDSHIFCNETKAYVSALAKLPKSSKRDTASHIPMIIQDDVGPLQYYCGMVSENLVRERCRGRQPLTA